MDNRVTSIYLSEEEEVWGSTEVMDEMWKGVQTQIVITALGAIKYL